MQVSETGITILDTIVGEKRREIDALRGREAELERGAAEAPAVRDFRGALAQASTVALIAEVKRRSPGAGEIRPGLVPADLAADYESGGASALSVLTDARFFGGSNADLSAVRERVGLPVLRKDFILDERQLLEARAAGADAVLLIVRILDDARLGVLLEEARDRLGMTVLVEAHDADEVDRALAVGADVLGINNRDLSTFTTRLDVTLELVERVPPGVIVVSESGIIEPAEVDRLGAVGIDAILVGEALLRDSDPRTGATRLSGRPRSPRSVPE
jgi:indole-3-glycerol phosphate synthase